MHECIIQTFICIAIFVVKLNLNWFGSGIFCLVVQHKPTNIYNNIPCSYIGNKTVLIFKTLKAPYPLPYIYTIPVLY